MPSAATSGTRKRPIRLRVYNNNPSKKYRFPLKGNCQYKLLSDKKMHAVSVFLLVFVYCCLISTVSFVLKDKSGSLLIGHVRFHYHELSPLLKSG